jgi:hypothetical protein
MIFFSFAYTNGVLFSIFRSYTSSAHNTAITTFAFFEA